jgi:hypothetical protein
VATFAVLKDLFIKLKRLYQVGVVNVNGCFVSILWLC